MKIRALPSGRFDPLITLEKITRTKMELEIANLEAFHELKKPLGAIGRRQKRTNGDQRTQP